MSYQGILFDFGGTLDADGQTWKERFFRLFREEHLSIAPAAFDPHFYGADDALVGTLPETLGLRDSVGRLARELATRLGLDADRAGGRVAARFLDDALARLDANRAVLDGCASATARRGLKLTAPRSRVRRCGYPPRST